jgi:hypothetical protein
MGRHNYPEPTDDIVCLVVIIIEGVMVNVDTERGPYPQLRSLAHLHR